MRIAAAIAGLSAIVALSAACGGPVQIKARTASTQAAMVADATDGAAPVVTEQIEQLAAHVALYVPPSEVAMTFQHYADGDEALGYELMVGEALRDLAAAHLGETIQIVDVAREARAPLDKVLPVFLLEMNTRAFDASIDGTVVDWEIGVRIADEVSLRSFRTYTAKGTAANPRHGITRDRETRLEIAANDAMQQIIGQLWGDLKTEIAKGR